MSKKEPYTQFNIEKRKEAMKNNDRDKLSENFSKSLRDLVDICLTLDQGSRPNIEQIIRYPIIRAEL
jgi:hypothetical protein